MKSEKEITTALKATMALRNNLPKEVTLVLMGFLDALQWVIGDQDIPTTLITLSNFDPSIEKEVIEELKQKQ